MRCIVSCGILLGVALASFAAAPPSEPKVLKIELHAWEGSRHVKVARIEATADEKGERFLLSGLTTLQPVGVGVEAKNPGDVFTLTLFKDGWKDPKREVSTSTAPLAVSEFRTYGEARILVTSASGRKPFVLRVVVGDEVRRPMKPAYVPMDEYRTRHPEAFSSWRSPWVFAGIGIAIAIAAAGAYFVLKRRKA